MSDDQRARRRLLTPAKRAIALAGVVAFVLAGCSSAKESGGATNTTSTNTTAAAGTETTQPASQAASAPAASPTGGSGHLAQLVKAHAATVGIVNQLPGSGLQPDGTLTGFSPDLMNQILPPMGITKLTPKVAEWSTLIPGLQADRWDFVGAQMVINADRCKQVLFSNPWSASPEVFAYVNGTAPSTLKAVAADPKLKLAVQSGSTFLKPIADAGIKDSQLVTVADIRSGLDALTAGRADLLIAGKPSILGIKDLDKRVKLSADITDAPISYTSYVFKQGDTALQAAFNQAIAKLQADGTLATISKKWGYDAEDVAGKTAAGLCQQLGATS